MRAPMALYVAPRARACFNAFIEGPLISGRTERFQNGIKNGYFEGMRGAFT